MRETGEFSGRKFERTMPEGFREKKNNKPVDLTLYHDDTVSLRELVFRTLRDAILENRLQPGTRLMELHLANQLGVSRTPVREAIRLLEMDGLVKMNEHRGAVVAGIEASDLKDVLEVRMALEELAVRKACRNMDREMLARLEQAEEEFEQSLLAGEDLNNPSKSAMADVHFHELITEAAHNRRLELLLTSLREQIYRYRLENLKIEMSLPYLVSEHKALIEAFREKDEEQAARTICRHIENQKVAILSQMK
jgi:DNA-binding GntR family transcriptional regulator